jgi:hypothetical protein
MEIRLTARRSGDAPGSAPLFEESFQQDLITIGNDPEATLRLNGSVVASEQVVIVDGTLEPLIINRAEGTLLNGERLSLNARRLLKTGDLLVIGTYVISVVLDDGMRQPGPLTARDRDTRDFGAENAPLNDEGFEDFFRTSRADPTRSRPSDDSHGAFPSRTDSRTRPPKSFAAILDGLRTDEDRFYFVIEGSSQNGVRAPIEREEMPVGWDETRTLILFEISYISDLLVIVRKDWGGVAVHPQSEGRAFVNDEPLDVPRRLREGDRISFVKANQGQSLPVLVFREPTAVVILDSLLPRPLPSNPDPAPAVESSGRAGLAVLGVHEPVKKLAGLVRSDKEYFGTFTFAELSLMAIGTLVGAIIIFLILNYS